MNTTHPIAIAVEPQRAAAIAATIKGANELIAKMTAELEAAGWDLAVTAPRPRNNMSRREYMGSQARRARFCLIFSRVPVLGYIPNPVEIYQPSPALTEKFIADAIARANDDYDSFIAKLIEKVGECDSAELAGDHVWSSSTLTVTKGETVERWKTKRILNVSVLGKLFNQWPTRKMK
jgi:hypothetical protein